MFTDQRGQVVTVRRRPQTGTVNRASSQGPDQQLARAVGLGERQQGQYPVLLTDQTQHAVQEKIHGAVQIALGEMQPFRDSSAARCLQGDHPPHLALGHANHTLAVPGQIRGGHQGQTRQTVSRLQARQINAFQPVPMPRAAVAGMTHGLAQRLELRGVKISPTPAVSQPQTPRGQGIHGCSLHSRPRYRACPWREVRL